MWNSEDQKATDHVFHFCFITNHAEIRRMQHMQVIVNLFRKKKKKKD